MIFPYMRCPDYILVTAIFISKKKGEILYGK